MEQIKNKIDSNYGGIYSWKGTANIQCTASCSKPVERFPDKQHTEYEYDYIFDIPKGNFLSCARLKSEYSIYGMKKVHLLLSNRNYMRINDVCYSFNWHDNRDVETFAYNASDLTNKVATLNNQITRTALVHVEPFKTQNLANFFDPFVQSYYKSDALETFSSAIGMMYKNGFTNLSEYKLRDGESAKLTNNNDKYTFDVNFNANTMKESQVFVFDKKQGFNIVKYTMHQVEYETKKTILKKEFACDYEQVNSFWVPKYLTEKIYATGQASGETTSQTTVRWNSHSINTPSPSDSFTLQSLGLRQGDELYDHRTQQKTIIAGDDFPESFEFDTKRIERHSNTRYIIMGLGIVLIITAITMKYFQYRNKNK
ncbi:MAG: hypothetical protein LBU65_00450 [Planctomycetaceae bacterium]|nr:hypothetical protein [Planctomycetaceae bacterium]